MVFGLALAVPAQAAQPDWQGSLSAGQGPVAQKLLFWLSVTAPPSAQAVPDTREMVAFTLENSDWPRLSAFRTQVEKGMTAAAGFKPYEIAAWFDQNPPTTASGIGEYVGALTALGHADRARGALNKFWPDADLNKQETADLTRFYRNLFSVTAHLERLDNLLWEQRYQEAEAMLPLVDAGHRKLATARISLGRLSSRAPKDIRAVPAELQNDSGLLFDRLRWRRQMNKDNDAYDLLMHAPRKVTHPDIWWRERNILARRAIEKRDFARAYHIIASHGLTSGPDYSQAEWTLGWLSLRFLHQPERAYTHFDRFYQAVTYAVSRARAGYWLARTAEALHKPPEVARNWDTLAAGFTSTFYGQLSHEKIGGTVDPAAFPDDQVPPEAQAAFDGNELVQATRLLAKDNLSKYADPFFLKLLLRAQNRVDYVLIAGLARESGRNRYAVEANKLIQQKLGGFLFEDGYPLLPALPSDKPESALVHAIVHRESMFDTSAQSPAGASGLMQLMPATAKHISKKLGKAYHPDKLTGNPEYNVELGSAYLESLIDAYDGYYPLAIAAYNAGPSNVRQWLKEFGDPRDGKIDIVDWVELVPIYETRNYVQRVMESYYMYRLRLSEPPRTIHTF